MIKTLTGCVLAAAIAIGFWIAHHKPLWNDELFSLTSSIERRTYFEIAAGRIEEGNNTPLFYIIQKLVCDLADYTVPAPWMSGDWGHMDYPSQLLLRINPVVFMALSFALVFYYFSRKYGLVSGVFSLFVYACSYMIWVYWAEARPYALIIFLTTAQMIIFLKMTHDKDDRPLTWNMLAVVHILLSLTFAVSLGQILAVSSVLFIVKSRNMRKYIWLTIVPVVLTLFYYNAAPHYSFWFDLTPEQLVRDNMSRDRFYISFMFIAALTIYGLQNKGVIKRAWLGDDVAKAVPFTAVLVLSFLFTIAVLVYLKTKVSPPDEGFPITSRYFIYLTPMGVIAAVLFSSVLLRSVKNRWAQIMVIAAIAALVIPRFFKIVPGALRSIAGGS